VGTDPLRRLDAGIPVSNGRSLIGEY